MTMGFVSRHCVTFALPISRTMSSSMRGVRRSRRLSASNVCPLSASHSQSSSGSRDLNENGVSKKRRKVCVVARSFESDAVDPPTPLMEGKLLKRYKRFFADVDVPGVGIVTAHCANPGSMRGMGLDTGSAALISPSPPGSKRKLAYRLEAIKVDGKHWVGCNTQTPNNVIRKWLEAKGAVATGLFGDYEVVKPEVVYGSDGRSRVDFLLQYAQGDDPSSPGYGLPYYVEVKNVTMACDDEESESRVAVFPDSKTARGQKHLVELADVVRRKTGRACVIYFVNRTDTASFAPCTIDSKYVELFYESQKAGVVPIPLEFSLVLDPASNHAVFQFSRRLPLHGTACP